MAVNDDPYGQAGEPSVSGVGTGGTSTTGTAPPSTPTAHAPGIPYSSLAAALGHGDWTPVPGSLTKEAPRQIPNPDADRPGQGPTINVDTGRWQIQFTTPEGVNRSVFLTPGAGSDPGAPNTDPTSSQITWHIASAPTDVPAGAADKTKPTATGQLDKIDADGNLVAQTGKPAVALRDPATGTVIPLPKDPNGTVTQVGDGFVIIKPDGSSTPVVDAQGIAVKASEKPSTFNVPGVGLVSYDPSKPEGSRTTVEIPTPTGMKAKDLGAQATMTINGQVWVAIDGPDGQIVWAPAKDAQGNDLPTQTKYTVAQNDPRSDSVLLIDDNGNYKAIPKPNWTKPPSPAAGQAVTPDNNAPFIVTIGDDGKPVFTKNTNQVSITDAQRQLISQLGQQVAAGSMTEDQAKNLITSITQSLTSQASVMNAGANAAQTGLSAIAQGAQSGAGLLQNRVTNTQQLVNNAVSPLSGHALSVPEGLGQGLATSAAAYATELGGGPGVYQAAANLVQRADPTNKLGGDAAGAYAGIAHILNTYQQLTGQTHPLVGGAQPVAQQQQQQQPAMVAPMTLSNAPQLASGGLGPVAGMPGAGGPNAFTAPKTTPTVVLNF